MHDSATFYALPVKRAINICSPQTRPSRGSIGGDAEEVGRASAPSLPRCSLAPLVTAHIYRAERPPIVPVDFDYGRGPMIERCPLLGRRRRRRRCWSVAAAAAIRVAKRRVVGLLPHRPPFGELGAIAHDPHRLPVGRCSRLVYRLILGASPTLSRTLSLLCALKVAEQPLDEESRRRVAEITPSACLFTRFAAFAVKQLCS